MTVDIALASYRLTAVHVNVCPAVCAISITMTTQSRHRGFRCACVGRLLGFQRPHVDSPPIKTMLLLLECVQGAFVVCLD